MRALFAWQYWDRVALVAGAIPLILLLTGFYAGEAFGGTTGHLIAGSLVLYFVSAAIAWRSGDGRFIAGGCAMLMVPAILGVPLLVILMACLGGNCL